MGGGHELPWADHSHIHTALRHKNNLNPNISTSQRSTWLLCSDTFKEWEQAQRAGYKGDQSTFFGCQGKLRREREKRDLEEWKGHMEDAPENRAGAQSWKDRSAKRSFPLAKGVSGDRGTRDVRRRKEERGWTEADPEKGEEKHFPKCLINSLSIFSQCLNQQLVYYVK